jgi:hypothetical protein
MYTSNTYGYVPAVPFGISYDSNYNLYYAYGSDSNYPIRYTGDGSNWSNATIIGYDPTNFYSSLPPLKLAYNNVLGITMGVVPGLVTAFLSNTASNVFAYDQFAYVPGNPVSFQSIRDVGFVLTTDAPSCLYSPNTHAWAPLPIACDPSTIVTSVIGQGTYVASLSNLPGQSYTDSNIAVGTSFNTADRWQNVISLQTTTSDSLSVSTLSVSTINSIPAGQGYTDTTTWQYNYIDNVGVFHPGILISTTTTIGFLVQRPHAPINYMNMVFAGTIADQYIVDICYPASTMQYIVTNQTGLDPEFVEISTHLSTVSSQVLSVCIDPNSNAMLLHSFSLGYN